MREILFKGKRIDNGEWVEGYLFDDGFVDSERVFIGSIVIEEHKGYGEDVWDIGHDFYEIIPKTVGQYTGLTDKNGKKIFEGDIVKLFLIDGIEIGVIKFNDIMCRFMFYDKSGGYAFDNTCVFEVIGNIHDNPELLKGE